MKHSVLVLIRGRLLLAAMTSSYFWSVGAGVCLVRPCLDPSVLPDSNYCTQTRASVCLSVCMSHGYISTVDCLCSNMLS